MKSNHKKLTEELNKGAKPEEKVTEEIAKIAKKVASSYEKVETKKADKE